ncbi:MAG: hypothetical protein PF518_16640 [Spirochaetaceae bacterium]|jgi:hypothetical protein|nr:hypothetical protein [Spirochaetaceae bacterium]
MNNYSTKELFCSDCGNTKDSPICCTQEMELDRYTFFCEICGKEEEVPKCCGSYMSLRNK